MVRTVSSVVYHQLDRHHHHHLNGNGVRDVGERGRDVEEEVEDDAEVVPVLRLLLQLGALHPDPRPNEALAARVDGVVRVGPAQVQGPRQARCAAAAAAAAAPSFATSERKKITLYLVCPLTSL